MSIQYQGVGAGEGCAPSHAEHGVEKNSWVKVRKTPDLAWADLGGGEVQGVATPPNGQSHSI